MKKRLGNGILKNMISFCKRHFALKIALPMTALVLFVALVFQGYLKSQYYKFLYQEVYRTDKVFLSTQQSIISDRIYTMVRLGSVFATNESFYQLVGEAFQDEDNVKKSYVITSALSEQVSYDNSIHLMAVVEEDGSFFQYNREHRSSDMINFWNAQNQDQLDEIYAQLNEKIEGKLTGDVKTCYVLTPEVKEKNGEPQYLLHMAVPIIGQQTSFSKTLGEMVITYDMDMLDGFLSMVDDVHPEYTYGFVTDAAHKIIYHEDSTKIGMEAEAYLEEIGAEAMSKTVSQTGWRLYMVIDKDAMLAHVNAVYQKSLWFYLFVLILLIFFIMLIYRYTLRMIKTISIALDTVRDGELNQKIEVLGEDEICRLAMQYNQMIDSLKDQQERTKEAYDKNIESLKRANEAEREALESQINAHFLCNTLSAFNYNAIQAGNEELSVMLRRLSNILRYTFSGSFQEVTVAQEIMWVEQYLYLQKYRLGDVFDYEIKYSEEYDAWPCCKLFIQPFVENSIAHGFEGREKGGFISINCSLNGERLQCVIADNGCGIPEEKLIKLQSMLQGDATMNYQGIGIGIENVTARLRMFYGSRFDITLVSKEGEGTTFTLCLPIPNDMSDSEEEEWL